MKTWTIAACLLAALTSASRAADMPHRDLWIAVADRTIQTPPQKLPFNWGEGVLLIGLLKVHDRTGDKRYSDYVERWFGQYERNRIAEILDSGKYGDETGGHKRGYCGHGCPGTAAYDLYQATGKSDYLATAELIRAYISEDATRHPLEGGLGHWKGNHQYWVDTLYMACPLLAALSSQYGEPELLDDAARQILVFAEHLQDDETGLFYHMWDWDSGKRTDELWARGNGWVLMSLADTFATMDRRDHRYFMLQDVAEDLAGGLLLTQREDSLWNTILDDPASYAEVSATAMFVYGLLKLVRLDVLSEEYVPVATEAWNALNKQFVKEGSVTGVSAGTAPQQGAEHYLSLPQGTYTWGTGAYLTAGGEVDRLN